MLYDKIGFWWWWWWWWLGVVVGGGAMKKEMRKQSTYRLQQQQKNLRPTEPTPAVDSTTLLKEGLILHKRPINTFTVTAEYIIASSSLAVLKPKNANQKKVHSKKIKKISLQKMKALVHTNKHLRNRTNNIF